MKTRIWMTLLGLNFGVGLLILSPFLPGPSNGLVNSIFSVAQMIGLVGLIIVPVGLYWTIKELRRKKKEGEHQIDLKALTVLTLPLTIFLTSFYFSAVVRSLSREVAMDRAENLILSIEEFKTENGAYPESLNDLTPAFMTDIPSPLVMGIEDYDYEKQDDGYTISFAQNVLMGFNFEVVIFDPKDNHKAEGESTEIYDTGRKHWRYYVYD
jgi:hypothetical protein